jgi:class 3 adenylate cyclase
MMPGMDDLPPLLARFAQGIEETGWAAELLDAEWRVRFVSTQTKAIMGGDDDDLGVGLHVLESRRLPLWRKRVPMSARIPWFELNVPLMIRHTPGGIDAIREMVEPDMRHLLDGMEPDSMPIWTAMGRVDAPDGAKIWTRYFGVQARSLEGKPMAHVYIYGSNLPASLLALVTRGDPALFARMARLVEPGRRQAALLFADVQASGALSRHLPSATYFELMRELYAAMDGAVISHGGIVGKHAGDGVTAFFLVDDAGSTSGAARAAIEVARAIDERTGTVAALAGVEEEDVRVNIGVHWGGTLYMGQVITGGRLEVTALGDETNECARVQQSARDGAILASKALVERLDRPDATALGLDLDRMTYRALAEMPGVTEKAVRDAGTLAVVNL